MTMYILLEYLKSHSSPKGFQYYSIYYVLTCGALRNLVVPRYLYDTVMSFQYHDIGFITDL